MKTMLKSFALTIAILLILTGGCQTTPKVAVTITQIEDSLMKSWAQAHNDHMTTPALDTKVMVAHAKFNEAKLVAAAAFKSAQAGGDQATAVQALAILRNTIPPLLDLLAPLLSPAQTTTAREQLSVAAKP